MKITNVDQYVSGFLLLVTIFSSQVAPAAWYDFAGKDGVPEISELSFGKVELTYLPDLYEFGSDRLEGKALVIRGVAEISDGKIGAVMVSVDEGKHWEKANVDANGAFNYEFVPQLEREYDFSIKTISTAGKSSDPEPTAFQFVVTRVTTEETAKEIFKQLLDYYIREDRSGFLSLVSDDFEGDLNALEDAIEDDFRLLDNVSISPTIIRTVNQSGEVEISFTYDRRVQVLSTGRILSDSGISNMSFRDTGEGLLLTSMAAPLIFGVSGTSEVATSVNDSSEGLEVLVISQDTGSGDVVAVGEDPQDAEDPFDPSDVRAGAVVLNCDIDIMDSLSSTCQGFNFLMQFVTAESPEDVFHAELASGNLAAYLDPGSPPPNFSTTDALINDLGTGTLSQFSSISSDEGDYSEAIPDGGPLIQIINGHVYGIMLDDVFAIIRVTTHTGNTTGDAQSSISVRFEYKVQMNGTANF